MTTDAWGRPLAGLETRPVHVLSIADAVSRCSEVIVAGWIVARDRRHIVLSDGSGSIELGADNVEAQIGDLVICGLQSDGGAIPCADLLVASRATPGARNTVENWDPNDIEMTHRFRFAHLRDPRYGQALRQASDLRCLISKYYFDRGFTYVDTPILSRTQCEYTDDDYIVLSRYTDRGVYSLPQSAQLYKQLLMGAGIWRYFQFSRCFRDEPIRRDALTEFTQVDVEVSFSTQDSLMSLAEDFIAAMFQQASGIRLERPFLRMPLAEALRKHGTDKPAVARQGRPLGVFIIDIPMAYRDSRGALRGYHHPMMAPDPRHLPLRPDDDLTSLRSTGFDIVIGGIEVGSGSMRISDYALQVDILDRLGFSGQDREELFGTLLHGLEFAFPPHGGFGIGFERLLMLLTEKSSLQDVCAFPKLRRDWCPLTHSPFVPRGASLDAYCQVLNSIRETAAGPGRQKEGVRLFAGAPVEDAPVMTIARSISQRGGCRFPMHIGDSHLPPPTTFQAAVQSRLANAALFRYSQPGGIAELSKALASRHSRSTGVSIDASQVLICNGATEATSAILNNALAPGDRVMLLSPHWPLIRGQVEQSKGTLDEIAFFQRGSAPQADRIKGILQLNLKPSTRMIYFATPNNPDGAIIDREALRTIIDFASERGLWVIADEVYEEQVYESGDFISALSVAPTYDRLVSVYSFSKMIGLPGIRVGYCLAHPKVREQLARVLQYTTYCVPSIWQYGCLAALGDLRFFQQQRAAFNDARLRTARALGVNPPRGSIYHFFEVRGESTSVAESLLREVDVALCPGQVGGSQYGSWLRMCFTSLPPDQAEEGAARVAGWLSDRRLLIQAYEPGNGIEGD